MRYELTDYEWASIKPMLPNKHASRVAAPYSSPCVITFRHGSLGTDRAVSEIAGLGPRRDGGGVGRSCCCRQA